jgi:peptidoglycan/LPS O-acetylase OafA/YrhL
MSHLAKCSYTLYLFHAPLILLLSSTTIRRADELWQPTANRLLMGLAVTAAVVLLADAVSWLTERRTAQLRNVFRRRAPAALSSPGAG